MLLVGDVGGTHTRLALVSGDTGTSSISREARMPSRKYAGLEEPVRAFLSGAPTAPDRAVFAVAGPVLGGSAVLTNLGWRIEQKALASSLGFKSVRLLNDLVAVAHAIPRLGPESLLTLQAGNPVPGGALAVVAPGTGLGEAFLTWDGQAYQVHPSEGGHAGFAPTGELQRELLAWLQAKRPHVSCEQVCSGRGMPDLYRFIKERGSLPERRDVAARLAQAEDPTPVIIGAAQDTPACPLSAAVIELFAAILAAEAGNVALRTLATGGVFLAGGLPRRLLPVLTADEFVGRFRDKGRLSSLLVQIPLHVVIRPGLGLQGAIQYALSHHDE